MKRIPIFLIPIALVLAAIAAVYFYIYPEYQFWRAAAEIDALYAAHRPFAYRWPGAPWSARALSQPAANQPLQPPPAPAPPTRLDSSQLTSALLILDSLGPRHSADPRWLILNARVSLLLGQYDDAVSRYRRAQILSPHPGRDLSAELAVAYALRGEHDQRASDFGPALENIQLALERPDAEHDTTPVSPSVHFDAGLILRESWLLRTSAEQFAAAAAGETSGSADARHWKKEAADSAEALRRFFDRREAAIARLQDPAQLNDADLAIPGGLEMAQKAAIEKWIAMTPVPRAVLERIAKEFKEKHGDRWWDDFLREPVSPEALQLLSGAEQARQVGSFAEEQAKAEKAERLFRALGNHAGRLWARWEEITGSRTGDHPQSCVGLLDGFDRDAKARSYRWLEATSWFESAGCRTILDHGGTLEAVYNTIQKTAKMGLEAIHLRSLASATEPYYSSRSPQLALRLALEGLSEYWGSADSEYRDESFCYNLTEVAELAGQRHAAVAAMREAVANIRNSPDRAFRAQLFSYLASYEARADLPEQARGHLSSSDRELSLSDPGRARKLGYRIKIEKASAFVASGRPTEAVAEMEGLLTQQSLSGEIWDEVMRADVLSTLGLGLLRLGRFADAATQYEESLACHNRVYQAAGENYQRESLAAWNANTFRGLIEARLKSGIATEEALAAWQDFRRAREPTPNSEPVRQTDPGSGLLTLAVLPDGISAWFTDSRGTEQRWLDPERLRKVVERLSGLAPDPNSPDLDIRRAARDLGSLVLDPFNSRLSALSASTKEPQLLIDADDFLTGVPWSLVENSKGEPLIERYSIVRTFDRDAKRLEKDPISTSARAVVFADPDLQGSNDFTPLPDARKEGERVAARFHNSVLIEGAAADGETFLRMAPNFDILHFEGHAVANGGFGALVLGGNPPLVDAQQISRLDLSRLRLAVLAGCSTGLGFESGSANADTLARGFLDAGAARVLAASWDVDSFASSQFMEHFYNELSQGRSAAVSLQRAALALRSNASTAHPSAWASFQLYGQP